jgi:hypothetical protein
VLRGVLPIGLAAVGARSALAQYPGPPITKDGTTVILEDYAAAPITGATTTTQLARLNFLRAEPAGSPQSANRFFLNDLNNKLYLFDKPTKSFSTYMNFQTIFNKFEADPYSGGMVTFAFDPEYATNGKFYTIHTENPSLSGSTVPNNFAGFSNAGYTTTTAIDPPIGSVTRQGIIVEWSDTNLNNGTFEGTAREVLRLGFNSNIHRMGDLIFNPLAQPGDADYRNLYFSNGDGEAGEVNATKTIPQRLDALEGKVLRITPDTSLRPGTSTISANGRYSVPTSGSDPNPYVSTSGARPEIFASGFRNPHRMDWDVPTNKLFINDIGLASWEEVNILTKGGNYGYSEREGTEQLFVGGTNNWKTGSQTNPPTPFPNPDTINVTGVGAVTPLYPVANYDHTQGDAIASGFIYRGSLIPELQGKFVFGDITTARLFWSDANEMIAADDGNRTSVAAIHELQVMFDSPLNASALEKRRMYDVVADEFAHRGGDPRANDTRGVLPGFAAIVGGWQGNGWNEGTLDADGVKYLGGRADIRPVLGGDGEIYLFSKSDGMIRRLTGAMHLWNPGQSGNWSATSNWTNGTADGIGRNAYFAAAASARTVTIDGGHTAGLLYIDSAAGSYTLNGNLSGMLHLDATGPQAGVYVASGNHNVSVLLDLVDDAKITVAQAGSTLTLSNLTSAGNTPLTKSGPGKLVVNRVLASALSIEAGTMQIIANGTAGGTSRAGTLTLAAGTTLDLTNNKLVTTTSVAAVTALVASGRNGNTLPLWDGAGIITSQSAATGGNFTSVGVARASDIGISITAVWSGQTVSGSDTLVMYTYGGDATLDGKINIDDYVKIDNGISAGLTGWSNGDFNYDGKINVDDYTTVIDANIGNQNGFVFPTAGGIDKDSAVIAIPEPAAVILLLPWGLPLRGKRIRKSA